MLKYKPVLKIIGLCSALVKFSYPESKRFSTRFTGCQRANGVALELAQGDHRDAVGSFSLQPQEG